jgi:Prephenate dehydratase
MILPSIGVSCQAVSTNQRIMRYESLLPETQIGFLGPKGTFAEQALLSEADLAAAQVRPYDSIPDVLNALVTEEVDLGFVPIENAIEGAVNVTQDSIAFDLDL